MKKIDKLKKQFEITYSRSELFRDFGVLCFFLSLIIFASTIDTNVDCQDRASNEFICHFYVSE